uniref:RNA polymerase II subunit A C-terminal domain phosphatase n=1 Tax=Panagrellus redivivus TaxID=6233 RepID=A0A7E4V4T2_PANRE
MTATPPHFVVFHPEGVVPEEGKGYAFLGFRASDGNVEPDTIICTYRAEGAPPSETKKLKAGAKGNVTLNRTFKRGTILHGGERLGEFLTCDHAIVIKDMCASCGKDFRLVKDFKNPRENQTASVSMVHHVPELMVSSDLANKLSDKEHLDLLKARKLVLLVDLDQTLIHTTNKPVPDAEMRPDIYSYNCIDGKYYTKLRPHTREFLERMNRLYEMHIITFGQRVYAHQIARILDEDQRYFAQRIMSRDELSSQRFKSENIAGLFPSEQLRKLIAIIDDRDDVWRFSESLVRVRPYKYFSEVDDINAPGYNFKAVAALANPKKDPIKAAGDETDSQKEPTKAEGDDADLNKEPIKTDGESDDSKKDAPADSEQDKEREETKDEDPQVKESETPDEPAADKPDDIDQFEPATGPGTNSDKPGPSNNILTLNHDSDDILEDIERVLTQVHTAFFEHYDATNDVIEVSKLLSCVRHEVFRHEIIALSGIVPLGADKKQVLLYRLLVHFGATVADEVNDETTVLVAARPSTEKVRQATKRGIPIVVPEWVYTCCGKYQLQPKDHFKLADVVPHHLLRGREKPFGNRSPKLSDLEPLNPDDMKDMEDEVDRALSESSDDESEKEEDSKDGLGDGDDDDDDEERGSDTDAEVDSDPNKEEVAAQMEEAAAAAEAADYEDPKERAELLAKLKAAEEEEDDDCLRNGDIESRKRRHRVESAGEDDEDGDAVAPKRHRGDNDDDEDEEPLVEPPADDDGDDGNPAGGEDESDDSWADDLESQLLQ